MKSLLLYLPNINKEGFVFIAIFFAISMILFCFSNHLGWIGVILTIFCVCFFRDPDRILPENAANYVLSPADGTVDNIQLARPPKELGMKDDEMTKISIFLSVFDIHVNRLPINGTVKALHYHPGKFISATLDKSSDVNERQSIFIEGDDGMQVAVVQIAGLIARRIVCNLDEGAISNTGERFGIIRFGSRVDVYIPKQHEVTTFIGQKTVGAQTILAKIKK